MADKDLFVSVPADQIVNEIYPFCNQGVDSRDLEPLEDYVADVQRLVGHQPGIARAQLANRQARQVSHICAGLAQFLSRRHAPGIVDDGDLDKIEAALVRVIQNISIQCAPMPNREIWVTESCEWVVPISGWYEILAIDGGYGGWVHYKNRSVWGGCSGAYKEAIAFFEKGQTVPITVGAGGPGIISPNGENTWPLTHGGITSVGDIDFSPYAGNRFMGQILYCSSEHRALAIGSGFGGQVYDSDEGTFYGAGGWAYIMLASQPASTALVGDGQDGAVRFRFYDPSLAAGPESEGEE